MAKKNGSRARPALPQIKSIQFKITLLEIKPPIWRRIALTNHHSLADLHCAIQRSMGWDNDHMHAFHIGKIEYAGYETARDCPGEATCDEEVLLHQVIKRRSQHFTYTYDFGDGWEHEIRVEEISPIIGKPSSPKCLDGQRACPPEDCGGAYS
ncbi:MAG: plasmid pRiA4b ORF-3 family protein [Opitutaceae bacterium]|jgi:hypothetical protein